MYTRNTFIADYVTRDTYWPTWNTFIADYVTRIGLPGTHS